MQICELTSAAQDAPMGFKVKAQPDEVVYRIRHTHFAMLALFHRRLNEKRQRGVGLATGRRFFPWTTSRGGGGTALRVWLRYDAPGVVVGGVFIRQVGTHKHDSATRRLSTRLRAPPYHRRTAAAPPPYGTVTPVWAEYGPLRVPAQALPHHLAKAPKHTRNAYGVSITRHAGS